MCELNRASEPILIARRDRRRDVRLVWAALTVICASGSFQTLQAGDLQLVERTKFLTTPSAGVRVNARTFYAYDSGLHLVSVHTLLSRSDTFDRAFRRFSADNGKTWSRAELVETHRESPHGVTRIYPRIGFADPTQTLLVEIELRGTLPNDDPLEGMKHWSLFYRLSRDGGRTTHFDAQIRQTGDQFSATHPLPGVHIGKNSIMIGDQSCMPIFLNNGEILQPVQITPVGPDGEYYNPGGGYTYHDAAVLIGTWDAQQRLQWVVSQRVVGDPSRSTRGMLEPTIVQLPNGKILMVLRGSNHRREELPSYRWYSLSADQGRTWSEPQPWTYTDGEAFYSPSSCSQLLKHSSGRIFWIGNISDQNPRGNLPRYPLVLGEVDGDRGQLLRESLITIDERRPDDPPNLLLSNFAAREDRATNDILIHLSPINRPQNPPTPKDGDDGQESFDWTADAWLYRVSVDAAK